MTSLQPSAHVKGNRLFIRGKHFENYEIVREIGSGENGVVYHGFNTLLRRDEAVKVWRARNPRDNRNKIEQGLREAQKLAQVSPDYAVAVYSAQQINGVFVATMEYVKGQTLAWHRQNSDPYLRCQLARIYLNAIVQTTTEATRHGDAHDKNVLVYEVATKYEKHLKIKLCDFGTSFYSGKEASEQRHWRIVRDTILSLTIDLPHASVCRDVLDRDWPTGVRLASDAYEARKNGIDFKELDIAHLWSAPLLDYTRDLFDLNYRIPAASAS